MIVEQIQEDFSISTMIIKYNNYITNNKPNFNNIEFIVSLEDPKASITISSILEGTVPFQLVFSGTTTNSYTKHKNTF